MKKDKMDFDHYMGMAQMLMAGSGSLRGSEKVGRMLEQKSWRPCSPLHLLIGGQGWVK